MPSPRRGVLIAIKDTVAFKLLSKEVDNHGHFIILRYDLNNTPYTLVNVYLLNNRPLTFLKKIWKKVQQHIYGNTILCGDFNAISLRSLDMSNPTQNHSGRSILQDFISSSNLRIFLFCSFDVLTY